MATPLLCIQMSCILITFRNTTVQHIYFLTFAYIVYKMDIFGNNLSSLMGNAAETGQDCSFEQHGIDNAYFREEKSETFHLIKHSKENKNFCKSISLMDNDSFYKHFHMQMSTFNNEATTGRKGVSLKKGLYLTIWRLANNNSFRQISDRFDVGMGATYRVFVRMARLICNLKSEIIVFPKTAAEQKAIADKFAHRRQYPFPFDVGCIDGTHINITQPKKDAISFYNRKGTFSIIAQGVVDSDMKFLDVFIGCPGRCHDASVWRMSPLYKSIISGELKIAENYHLLGDSAYPLDAYLMVSYRDNGHLTPVQSKFNTILSSTRVFVEQAYGILKKKIRILKFIDVQSADMPRKIVLACMVIHNFIIMNAGQESANPDLLPAEESEPSQATISTMQTNEAKIKRNSLEILFSS